VPEPLDPHPANDAEQERHREAHDRGDPFLSYRNGRGALVVLSLTETWSGLTIGRGSGADIGLWWDREVSAMHAQLERLGTDWVLADDGLSRNGSFVNGERVAGRRRLCHGDELRFGRTSMVFSSPLNDVPDATIVPSAAP
jgi:hypothetical protein